MSQPAPPNAPELSRIIDVRHMEDGPLTLSATPEECAKLARRFDLVRVITLTAILRLMREGTKVNVAGKLVADIVQPCAVSAEDMAVTINEPLAFRFVPAADVAVFAPDEELEITEEDCDEIAYEGGRFDLGEAVAQSLGLAIDPFLTGPGAEQVRTSGLLSEENTSPFAALAALKKDK